MWNRLLLVAGLACLPLSGQARFAQEVEGSVDFDFLLDGKSTPACRILAPEQLAVEGRDLGKEVGERVLHTTPGKLTRRGDTVTVERSYPGAFSYRLELRPRATYFDLTFLVRNLGNREWRDLKADFCLGLSRLPSRSRPWSNEVFFRSVPPDRTEQGALWYSHITPKRLMYYWRGQWHGLHPNPLDPDPKKVPLYNAAFSNPKPARIVALQPEAGQQVFFLMFDTESSAREPFPGNACMHLDPLMANRVKPGESAVIKGKAGFGGTSLEDAIGLLRNMER